MAQRLSQTSLRRILVGLTILVGPISFTALAQDYVDVEAERRAAAAAGTASQPASGGSPIATGGAVSYGVGNAPPATTRTLPPPAPPSADSVGGMFNQVQQLQQEVMRLNGVVEQLTYELNQLKEQSLERYLDVDRRLAAGGAAAGGTPAAGSGSNEGGIGPDAAAVGQATVQEQPGEGEAYRSAYALVRGQEFDAAVAAFTQFLGRFPDGRYAPNAHYWLGELYLVVDPPDPEAARQSFMLLLNQYPDNAKIPDALYKLGRVHFIKGSSDRSREFLNRVIRDYPDSSAARLAGDFLDQNF
jgi:tol-pal system protein YbgF